MDETPGYGGWFAADMSIATGPAVVGYAKSRAVLRQSTRKEKPVRSSKLQLGLAAAAVIALAVTLGVRRGVIDVLLRVGIAAAVAGMYLLRRYARAGLVYNRHVESASADLIASNRRRQPFLPTIHEPTGDQGPHRR